MRGLAANDIADLDCRPNGNRALVDDDFVAVEGAGNFAGNAKDVLQVRRAIFAGRRADGDEHDLRLVHAARQSRGEGQTLFALVSPNKLLEPWLVNGDLPPLQHPDLGRVLVDADDLVAILGKARAGHQPDVASAHHRYLHLPCPSRRTQNPKASTA